MRKSLHVLTLVVFLFSAASTYAEFPLSTYAELKNNDKFKGYVTGVGRGIFWANVVMEAQGRSPLFCMPNKLALDEGLILSLLDQEIRSSSVDSDYKADTSIELILTNAFIKRFPCR